MRTRMYGGVGAGTGLLGQSPATRFGFILISWLSHSQIQNFFSPADSGRISGQADIYFLYPNVMDQAEAPLGADSLESMVQILIMLFNRCCGGAGNKAGNKAIWSD